MSYNKEYGSIITHDDVRVKEHTYARSLWRNIYIWMALGLGLTASVAYFTANTPAIRSVLISNYFIFSMILMISLFALSMNISMRLQTMSMGSAVACYVAYTVIEGLLLFTIFLYYPSYILIKTFACAAAMFVGMSLWGAFSKTDLSAVGRFCVMAVWGLIIATLINLFVKSSLFDYIISFVGVFVFAGLTAYDTQKIAVMSRELSEKLDESGFVKMSILGALILYVDFIGLFLFLLRIFSGGRRE